MVKGHGPPGPTGLVMEVVDEELAVFAWDVERLDEARLTEAERDVLVRIVAGASNAQIARARTASVRTVANQVASLLRKLNAASRYELIQRYARDRTT
ncbi:MAG: response regulator transcription factor [Kofleriaceae bacterium]